MTLKQTGNSIFQISRFSRNKLSNEILIVGKNQFIYTGISLYKCRGKGVGKKRPTHPSPYLHL